MQFGNKVMDFQLTYRMTFIDTIEPPEVENLRRSRSLPVLGNTPAADEEIDKKEPWTVRWSFKEGLFVNGVYEYIIIRTSELPV